MQRSTEGNIIFFLAIFSGSIKDHSSLKNFSSFDSHEIFGGVSLIIWGIRIVDTSVLSLSSIKDSLKSMELVWFFVYSGVWSIKIHGFFSIALSKSAWRLGVLGWKKMSS